MAQSQTGNLIDVGGGAPEVSVPIQSSQATLDLFKSSGTSDDESIFLEGQLTAPGPAASGPSGSSGFASNSGDSGIPANTLDEPVKDTILRDIRAVAIKFKHVLYPKERKSLLRDWDLWGPLILCTFMATILQGHVEEAKPGDSQGDGGPEFAEVFVIVWLGALVVTLNTKFLGGNISFFQSVCVLGYCLLPLGMSLGVCEILLYITPSSTGGFIFRCGITLVGFVWAVYAAFQFLGDCQPANRKALAAYPMGLFYFVIAWLVLSHN